MIPVGYMAKKISDKPDWIKADNVTDIYSVSNCISDDFTDYIDYWKHNGYWFFDSPEVIEILAKSEIIDLTDTEIFYYEVYEKQLAETWESFKPEPSFITNIIEPQKKYLEGFDIVTFTVGTSPECSPLSCCSLATEIKTNRHCLLDTFVEAKQHLENGKFDGSEPGPYRIFAVYSLEKP